MAKKRKKQKKILFPPSAPSESKSGKKSIGPDTVLILDTNEFIFGLTGTKQSSVDLLDHLGALTIVIPAMVVREARANLQHRYQLGKEFFRLVATGKNFTILWIDPPQEIIEKHIALGFAEEDAAIAAAAEWVGAEFVISENRHFLQRKAGLSFLTIDAERALELLRQQ
jgi:hypothetical protein